MASSIDPDIAADFGSGQSPAPAATTRPIDPDISSDFSAPPSAENMTIGHGALGALELSGSLVPNALATIGNAGIDLASRVSGFGPRTPIPTVSGGAGRDLATYVRNLVPKPNPNSMDAQIDRIRAQRAPDIEGTFGEDLARNALEVGGDVATLAPVAAGARALVSGIGEARAATSTAIEEGHPLSADAQSEARRIASARNAAESAGLSIPEKDITPLQEFVRTQAREDLGLPANSPVTPDFLDKAISKKAGPIFDAVESTPVYKNGPKYAAAVKGIDASKIEPFTVTETAADGSITARQLKLPQPGDSIDGSDTLALSREYRERADMAYTDASNPNLTSAQRRAAQIEGANYKAAAKAVEAGYSDAEPVTAKKWDAARQYTAKVKAWQSAADSAGNVDPTKIKRMVAGESITSPAMHDAATVAAGSSNKMPGPSLATKIIRRTAPIVGGVAGGMIAGPGGSGLGAGAAEHLAERLP